MSFSSAFQNMLYSELFITLSFLVGLLLGSFYSVCISRTIARLNLEHEDVPTEGAPAATSILWPPSHCPHCRTPLRARDLVPVFSYLWLRGRCATCRAPIHPGYLLIELFSGGIATLLALRYGPSGAFLVYLAFCGVLIVASGIDFGTLILPDVLTLGGVVPAMLCAVFVLDLSWTETLLGSLLGGGSFWIVLIVFKKLRNIDGMGMGDIKLMFLIGALSGPQSLPFVVLAAGLSALLAFPLFLRFGRNWFNWPEDALIHEMPVPFGPFLSLGAFVHILAGSDILHWWLLISV